MARVFGLLSFLFLFGHLQAQTYDYSIGKQTEKVDSFRYWLEELVSFGARQSGTDELNHSKEWIISKYSQFGYSRIYLDSFEYGGNELYNIIIEKPGLDTNAWIIIGSHYDSKNGVGANDNGSGVVATMEIARIMLNIETRVGIRFIHFAAEEQGLIGSAHYVQSTLDTSQDLQLMFNLDQLGGTKGEDLDNQKIYCEADNSGVIGNNELSSRKTDTLMNLLRLYSFLEPVKSNAFASDYLSFEDMGYVITGLYQYSDYPYLHSSSDLIENMDLDALDQVIRAALAAAMYFSRNTLTLAVDDLRNAPLLLYPNPVANTLWLRSDLNIEFAFEIRDTKGLLVYSGLLKPGTGLDLSGIASGCYYAILSSEQDSSIHYSRIIIAAD